MTNPATPTPAEAAVEYLKAELPGFAAQFDPGTHTFRVRGALRFGAAVAGEPLVYLAPENAKRYLDELVDKTRRNAIEALGLDGLVKAELQRARHEAFAEGKAAGVAKGRREGRLDALVEILAATETFYVGGDDE